MSSEINECSVSNVESSGNTFQINIRYFEPLEKHAVLEHLSTYPDQILFGKNNSSKAENTLHQVGVSVNMEEHKSVYMLDRSSCVNVLDNGKLNIVTNEFKSTKEISVGLLDLECKLESELLRKENKCHIQHESSYTNKSTCFFGMTKKTRRPRKNNSKRYMSKKLNDISSLDRKEVFDNATSVDVLERNIRLADVSDFKTNDILTESPSFPRISTALRKKLMHTLKKAASKTVQSRLNFFKNESGMDINKDSALSLAEDFNKEKKIPLLHNSCSLHRSKTPKETEVYPIDESKTGFLQPGSSYFKPFLRRPGISWLTSFSAQQITVRQNLGRAGTILHRCRDKPLYQEISLTSKNDSKTMCNVNNSNRTYFPSRKHIILCSISNKQTEESCDRFNKMSTPKNEASSEEISVKHDESKKLDLNAYSSNSVSTDDFKCKGKVNLLEVNDQSVINLNKKHGEMDVKPEKRKRCWPRKLNRNVSIPNQLCSSPSKETLESLDNPTSSVYFRNCIDFNASSSGEMESIAVRCLNSNSSMVSRCKSKQLHPKRSVCNKFSLKSSIDASDICNNSFKPCDSTSLKLQVLNTHSFCSSNTNLNSTGNGLFNPHISLHHSRSSYFIPYIRRPGISWLLSFNTQAILVKKSSCRGGSFRQRSRPKSDHLLQKFDFEVKESKSMGYVDNFKCEIATENNHLKINKEIDTSIEKLHKVLRYRSPNYLTKSTCSPSKRARLVKGVQSNETDVDNMNNSLKISNNSDYVKNLRPDKSESLKFEDLPNVILLRKQNMKNDKIGNISKACHANLKNTFKKPGKFFDSSLKREDSLVKLNNDNLKKQSKLKTCKIKTCNISTCKLDGQLMSLCLNNENEAKKQSKGRPRKRKFIRKSQFPCTLNESSLQLEDLPNQNIVMKLDTVKNKNIEHRNLTRSCNTTSYLASSTSKLDKLNGLSYSEKYSKNDHEVIMQPRKDVCIKFTRKNNFLSKSCDSTLHLENFPIHGQLIKLDKDKYKRITKDRRGKLINQTIHCMPNNKYGSSYQLKDQPGKNCLKRYGKGIKDNVIQLKREANRKATMIPSLCDKLYDSSLIRRQIENYSKEDVTTEDQKIKSRKLTRRGSFPANIHDATLKVSDQYMLCDFVVQASEKEKNIIEQKKDRPRNFTKCNLLNNLHDSSRRGSLPANILDSTLKVSDQYMSCDFKVCACEKEKNIIKQKKDRPRNLTKCSLPNNLHDSSHELVNDHSKKNAIFNPHEELHQGPKNSFVKNKKLSRKLYKGTGKKFNIAHSPDKKRKSSYKVPLLNQDQANFDQHKELPNGPKNAFVQNRKRSGNHYKRTKRKCIIRHAQKKKNLKDNAGSSSKKKRSWNSIIAEVIQNKSKFQDKWKFSVDSACDSMKPALNVLSAKKPQMNLVYPKQSYFMPFVRRPGIAWLSNYLTEAISLRKHGYKAGKSLQRNIYKEVYLKTSSCVNNLKSDFLITQPQSFLKQIDQDNSSPKRLFLQKSNNKKEMSVNSCSSKVNDHKAHIGISAEVSANKNYINLDPVNGKFCSPCNSSGMKIDNIKDSERNKSLVISRDILHKVSDHPKRLSHLTKVTSQISKNLISGKLDCDAAYLKTNNSCVSKEEGRYWNEPEKMKNKRKQPKNQINLFLNSKNNYKCLRENNQLNEKFLKKDISKYIKDLNSIQKSKPANNKILTSNLIYNIRKTDISTVCREVHVKLIRLEDLPVGSFTFDIPNGKMKIKSFNKPKLAASHITNKLYPKDAHLPASTDLCKTKQEGLIQAKNSYFKPFIRRPGLAWLSNLLSQVIFVNKSKCKAGKSLYKKKYAPLFYERNVGMPKRELKTALESEKSFCMNALEMTNVVRLSEKFKPGIQGDNSFNKLSKLSLCSKSLVKSKDKSHIKYFKNVNSSIEETVLSNNLDIGPDLKCKKSSSAFKKENKSSLDHLIINDAGNNMQITKRRRGRPRKIKRTITKIPDKTSACEHIQSPAKSSSLINSECSRSVEKFSSSDIVKLEVLDKHQGDLRKPVQTVKQARKKFRSDCMRKSIRNQLVVLNETKLICHNLTLNSTDVFYIKCPSNSWKMELSSGISLRCNSIQNINILSKNRYYKPIIRRPGLAWTSGILSKTEPSQRKKGRAGKTLKRKSRVQNFDKFSETTKTIEILTHAETSNTCLVSNSGTSQTDKLVNESSLRKIAKNGIKFSAHDNDTQCEARQISNNSSSSLDLSCTEDCGEFKLEVQSNINMLECTENNYWKSNRYRTRSYSMPNNSCESTSYQLAKPVRKSNSSVLISLKPNNEFVDISVNKSYQSVVAHMQKLPLPQLSTALPSLVENNIGLFKDGIFLNGNIQKDSTLERKEEKSCIKDFNNMNTAIQTFQTKVLESESFDTMNRVATYPKSMDLRFESGKFNLEEHQKTFLVNELGILKPRGASELSFTQCSKRRRGRPQSRKSKIGKFGLQRNVADSTMNSTAMVGKRLKRLSEGNLLYNNCNVAPHNEQVLRDYKCKFSVCGRRTKLKLQCKRVIPSNSSRAHLNTVAEIITSVDKFPKTVLQTKRSYFAPFVRRSGTSWMSCLPTKLSLERKSLCKAGKVRQISKCISMSFLKAGISMLEENVAKVIRSNENASYQDKDLVKYPKTHPAYDIAYERLNGMHDVLNCIKSSASQGSILGSIKNSLHDNLSGKMHANMQTAISVNIYNNLSIVQNLEFGKNNGFCILNAFNQPSFNQFSLDDTDNPVQFVKYRIGRPIKLTRSCSNNIYECTYENRPLIDSLNISTSMKGLQNNDEHNDTSLISKNNSVVSAQLKELPESYNNLLKPMLSTERSRKFYKRKYFQNFIMGSSHETKGACKNFNNFPIEVVFQNLKFIVQEETAPKLFALAKSLKYLPQPESSYYMPYLRYPSKCWLPKFYISEMVVKQSCCRTGKFLQRNDATIDKLSHCEAENHVKTEMLGRSISEHIIIRISEAEEMDATESPNRYAHKIVDKSFLKTNLKCMERNGTIVKAKMEPDKSSTMPNEISENLSNLFKDDINCHKYTISRGYQYGKAAVNSSNDFNNKSVTLAAMAINNHCRCNKNGSGNLFSAELPSGVLTPLPLSNMLDKSVSVTNLKNNCKVFTEYEDHQTTLNQLSSAPSFHLHLDKQGTGLQQTIKRASTGVSNLFTSVINYKKLKQSKDFIFKQDLECHSKDLTKLGSPNIHQLDKMLDCPTDLFKSTTCDDLQNELIATSQYTAYRKKKRKRKQSFSELFDTKEISLDFEKDGCPTLISEVIVTEQQIIRPLLSSKALANKKNCEKVLKGNRFVHLKKKTRLVGDPPIKVSVTESSPFKNYSYKSNMTSDSQKNIIHEKNRNSCNYSRAVENVAALSSDTTPKNNSISHSIHEVQPSNDDLNSVHLPVCLSRSTLAFKKYKRSGPRHNKLQISAFMEESCGKESTYDCATSHLNGLASDVITSCLQLSDRFDHKGKLSDTKARHTSLPYMPCIKRSPEKFAKFFPVHDSDKQNEVPSILPELRVSLNKISFPALVMQEAPSSTVLNRKVPDSLSSVNMESSGPETEVDNEETEVQDTVFMSKNLSTPVSSLDIEKFATVVESIPSIQLISSNQNLCQSADNLAETSEENFNFLVDTSSEKDILSFSSLKFASVAELDPHKSFCCNIDLSSALFQNKEENTSMLQNFSSSCKAVTFMEKSISGSSVLSDDMMLSPSIDSVNCSTETTFQSNVSDQELVKNSSFLSSFDIRSFLQISTETEKASCSLVSFKQANIESSSYLVDTELADCESGDSCDSILNELHELASANDKSHENIAVTNLLEDASSELICTSIENHDFIADAAISEYSKILFKPTVSEFQSFEQSKISIPGKQIYMNDCSQKAVVSCTSAEPVDSDASLNKITDLTRCCDKISSLKTLSKAALQNFEGSLSKEDRTLNLKNGVTAKSFTANADWLKTKCPVAPHYFCLEPTCSTDSLSVGRHLNVIKKSLQPACVSMMHDPVKTVDEPTAIQSMCTHERRAIARPAYTSISKEKDNIVEILVPTTITAVNDTMGTSLLFDREISITKPILDKNDNSKTAEFTVSDVNLHLNLSKNNRTEEKVKLYHQYRKVEQYSSSLNILPCNVLSSFNEISGLIHTEEVGKGQPESLCNSSYKDLSTFDAFLPITLKPSNIDNGTPSKDVSNLTSSLQVILPKGSDNEIRKSLSVNAFKDSVEPVLESNTQSKNKISLIEMFGTDSHSKDLKSAQNLNPPLLSDYDCSSRNLTSAILPEEPLETSTPLLLKELSSFPMCSNLTNSENLPHTEMGKSSCGQLCLNIPESSIQSIKRKRGRPKKITVGITEPLPKKLRSSSTNNLPSKLSNDNEIVMPLSVNALKDSVEPVLESNTQNNNEISLTDMFGTNSPSNDFKSAQNLNTSFLSDYECSSLNSTSAILHEEPLETSTPLLLEDVSSFPMCSNLTNSENLPHTEMGKSSCGQLCLNIPESSIQPIKRKRGRPKKITVGITEPLSKKLRNSRTSSLSIPNIPKLSGYNELLMPLSVNAFKDSVEPVSTLNFPEANLTLQKNEENVELLQKILKLHSPSVVPQLNIPRPSTEFLYGIIFGSSNQYNNNIYQYLSANNNVTDPKNLLSSHVINRCIREPGKVISMETSFKLEKPAFPSILPNLRVVLQKIPSSLNKALHNNFIFKTINMENCQLSASFKRDNATIEINEIILPVPVESIFSKVIEDPFTKPLQSDVPLLSYKISVIPEALDPTYTNEPADEAEREIRPIVARLSDVYQTTSIGNTNNFSSQKQIEKSDVAVEDQVLANVYETQVLTCPQFSFQNSLLSNVNKDMFTETVNSKSHNDHHQHISTNKSIYLSKEDSHSHSQKHSSLETDLKLVILPQHSLNNAAISSEMFNTSKVVCSKPPSVILTSSLMLLSPVQKNQVPLPLSISFEEGVHLEEEAWLPVISSVMSIEDFDTEHQEKATVNVEESLRKSHYQSNNALLENSSLQEAALQKWFHGIDFPKCIANWQKLFPWMRLENSNLTIYCSLCKSNKGILTLYKSQQAFSVSAKLRMHAKMPCHIVMNICGNQQMYHQICSFLKSYPYYLHTTESMLDNMKKLTCRMFETTPEILQLVINHIAEATEDKIILAIKGKKYSLIADPCRKMLILRYISDADIISEHFLFSYYLSEDLDPLGFLAKKNLPFDDLVYCNVSNFQQNKNINQFALRFPPFSELLLWLSYSKCFIYYDNVIKTFSRYYKKLPHMFASLEDAHLLNVPSINNRELFYFVRTNLSTLGVIGHEIHKVYGLLDSAGMQELNLQLDTLQDIIETLALISSDLDKISIINNGFPSCPSIDGIYQRIQVMLKEKLENAFQMANHEKLEALSIMIIFILELSTKDIYTKGFENTVPILSLFCPEQMMALNSETVDMVYNIAIPHYQTSKAEIQRSFWEFGKYLSNQMKVVSIKGMLEVFQKLPNLKLTFPLCYNVYKLLSLMPSFSAHQERSFFAGQVLLKFLLPKLSPELCASLISIYVEQEV